MHESKLAVAIGIADPKIKMEIYKKMKKNRTLYFPVLIAPTAFIEENTEIQEGTIISNFSLISTSVKIGECVFFNTGCFIGHDTEIGSFSTFMPSSCISGSVVVSEGVLVGAQSFVLQGRSIGNNSVISAGSKVFSDVPHDVTVFGNPAYVINKK